MKKKPSARRRSTRPEPSVNAARNADAREIADLRNALRVECEKTRDLARANNELMRRIDSVPVRVGAEASVTLTLDALHAQYLREQLRRPTDLRGVAIHAALDRVTR